MKRKKIKKLCWRKNNTNNEEDLSGINLNRIQSLPLSSLSGSVPGDVIWCPSPCVRIPMIHSLWLMPSVVTLVNLWGL